MYKKPDWILSRDRESNLLASVQGFCLPFIEEPSVLALSTLQPVEKSGKERSHPYGRVSHKNMVNEHLLPCKGDTFFTCYQSWGKDFRELGFGF